MRSLRRSLLIWLMALALPLQGLAGTAMQHGALAAQQLLHRSAAYEAQLPLAPCHVQAAAAQGPSQGHSQGLAANASGAAAEAQASAAGVDDQHDCSACAACCSALGLPARAVPLAASTATSAVAPLPRAAVDSVVPAGLDRPPRPGFG